MSFSDQLRSSTSRLDLSTKGLGEKFITYLEKAKQWQENCHEDCKRWQNEFTKAIHSNWRIEHGVKSLSGISATERAKYIERMILESLHFPEITHRHDRIAEAYSKTFQWIYHGLRSEDKPWASFTDWLEHDSTLYWITGKAGSGKSTLMKYIYHDERTFEHLAKWSPDNAPLTAAFFFWSSGSNLQMSHEGLLRSLLFQLLKQSPALIPCIFPERWEVYNLFSSDSLAWTQEELTQGFKLLAKEELYQQKYCLFIDGLDEFNENHSSLIDVLNEISSSNHVKICVSSRPWITFEDAFKHSPNLMLENLTYPDIKYFVHSKFYPNAAFTRLQSLEPEYAGILLEAIVQKAAGVFLWVNLVVHSLLAGLVNADRIADLQRRLDFLPPDLENLYERMLNDLDPFYFEHASQYFRLVRASQEPPTLLRMFFADEEPESFQTFKAQIHDDHEQQLRADAMRRRINSRCKGLLEVSPGFSNHGNATFKFGDTIPPKQKDHATVFGSSPDSTVQYLHKTVKDFLESPKVWSRLVAATENGYNPHLALCKSFVLQLKCMDPARLDKYILQSIVRSCLRHVHCVQEMCDDRAIEQDLITVLDELDHAATELTKFTSTPVLFKQSLTPAKNQLLSPCWTCALPLDHGVVGNFLSLTVRLGFYFYVERKAKRGCLIVQDTGIWPLLADAVTLDETLIKSFGFGTLIDMKMIHLLLSRGADPNWECGSDTIWKTLLESIDEKARSKREDERVDMSLCLDVVLMFLQHGADRTVDLETRLATALLSAPINKSKKLMEMVPVPFFKRFTRLGRKSKSHEALMT